MHPEDFEKFLDAGGCLDPSDKNGKWYLLRDNVPNANFGAIKFYGSHAPQEMRDRLAQKIKEGCARGHPTV
jgi:hypothetical protein